MAEQKDSPNCEVGNERKRENNELKSQNGWRMENSMHEKLEKRQSNEVAEEYG